MSKKQLMLVLAWKWLFFLLVTGSLVVCSSKQKGMDKRESTDTKFVEHINSNYEADLLGIWGTSPDENATFQITKDTLYYPDADRRLYYLYKNGKIICFDENNDTNFICTIVTNSKDSLVLKDDHTGHVSRFVRFP